MRFIKDLGKLLLGLIALVIGVPVLLSLVGIGWTTGASLVLLAVAALYILGGVIYLAVGAGVRHQREDDLYWED